MRKPKTIKGYISLIRQLEKIHPTWLKGFDALPEEDKENLTALDVEISNSINEVKSFSDENNE